jgi:hypothetical protein
MKFRPETDPGAAAPEGRNNVAQGVSPGMNRPSPRHCGTRYFSLRRSGGRGEGGEGEGAQSHVARRGLRSAARFAGCCTLIRRE